jgi:hypothetical protein
MWYGTSLLTLTGNEIECEDIAIHESCIKSKELAEVLFAVVVASSVPIPLPETFLDTEDSWVEKISGITSVEVAPENR